MGSSLLLRPGGGPNDEAIKLTHSATTTLIIDEAHYIKEPGTARTRKPTPEIFCDKR
jgi:hypothetical protein